MKIKSTLTLQHITCAFPCHARDIDKNNNGEPIAIGSPMKPKEH